MKAVKITLIVVSALFGIAVLLPLWPFLLVVFGQAIALVIAGFALAFVIAVITVATRRAERKSRREAALRRMEPLEGEARANGFVKYLDYVNSGSLMHEPQRSEMARILGFSDWDDYIADYKRRTTAGEWLPGLRPAVRFTYSQYPGKRKDYVWKPDDFAADG